MPVAIRHAELGLSGAALAVVEVWTMPAYHDDIGTPMEMTRYRVRVTGPLPCRPSEAGEFGMIVRRYGDRPGWWISPELENPAWP
jgi:hypothetical protein